jgi:hypothetical protein
MSPDRKLLTARRGGAPTVCHGKEPFDTKAMADAIAVRTRSRRDGNLGSYKCPACGKWHLGSSTGSRKYLDSAHKRALRAIREKELTG